MSKSKRLQAIYEDALSRLNLTQFEKWQEHFFSSIAEKLDPNDIYNLEDVASIIIDKDWDSVR